MTPENSPYNKEVSLEECVLRYLEGETVIVRFHDKEWYAAHVQCKDSPHTNTLHGITLDMLPHARYYILGDKNG
jgi:hypothetical protein